MNNFFKIWAPAVAIAFSVSVLPSCQKDSLSVDAATELSSTDRGSNPHGKRRHHQDTLGHQHDSTHVGGGHPHDSTHVGGGEPHDSTHVGGGHPHDSTHVGGGHPIDSTHTGGGHGGNGGGHGGGRGHGGGH
jgi:hypothetical protein